jgi:hypothetical protein
MLERVTKTDEEYPNKGAGSNPEASSDMNRFVQFVTQAEEKDSPGIQMPIETRRVGAPPIAP